RFFDLVEFIQIFYDLRVFARKRTDRSVEVRIRQMPNVEHQIRVDRIAEFMAEARYLYAHRNGSVRRSEFFDDRTPQRMNRQLARIDDHIRHLTNTAQSLAFGTDRRFQTLTVIGRMRTASFGEPSSENALRRLEKQHERSTFFFSKPHNSVRKFAKKMAFADIDDKSGFFYRGLAFFVRNKQPRECRKHCQR